MEELEEYLAQNKSTDKNIFSSCAVVSKRA